MSTDSTTPASFIFNALSKTRSSSSLPLSARVITVSAAGTVPGNSRQSAAGAQFPELRRRQGAHIARIGTAEIGEALRVGPKVGSRGAGRRGVRAQAAEDNPAWGHGGDLDAPVRRSGDVRTRRADFGASRAFASEGVPKKFFTRRTSHEAMVSSRVLGPRARSLSFVIFVLRFIIIRIMISEIRALKSREMRTPPPDPIGEPPSSSSASEEDGSATTFDMLLS